MLNGETVYVIVILLLWGIFLFVDIRTDEKSKVTKSEAEPTNPALASNRFERAAQRQWEREQARIETKIPDFDTYTPKAYIWKETL